MTMIIGTAFLSAIKLFEDDLRMASATPFFFVTADAVEEVEHRIFLVSRVAGWRIDQGFAFVTDRL